MGILTYQNLNLLITRSSDNNYLARVIDSPAGEAKVPFELPLLVTQLAKAISMSMQTRSLSLPQGTPAEEINHQEMGSILFKQVFQGDVKDVLMKSLQITQIKNQGLRLRLYLSEVPELVNIPWEYLYDDSTDKFFALSVHTPIVRYLALEDSTRPPVVDSPLNVLVMIASPDDHPPLDVEKEWKQLQGSLSGLIQNGKVSITRLEHATLEALQKELRQKPYHIFHFIGHGDFDEQSGDGVLVLESSDGSGYKASAKRIATLLHDENSVRLAVLNACEGSKTSLTNAFSGVGQSFVRQGIPAVIAMQYEVTDKTAILLSRELYRLLAEGYPIDTALAEVRKAIYSTSDMVEWGTPVLYLRTDTGEMMASVTESSDEAAEKAVVPEPTPLEGTMFSLVSPRYFEDEVRITRHQLDQNRIAEIFKKWMKQRDSQWPKSINPELLIKGLKPVYLANFVVSAEASANYKAQLGHAEKKEVSCQACNGTGEITSGQSARPCSACKGKGVAEEKYISTWEPVIDNISKGLQEDFRSYNQLDELESFKPGVTSEAAANRFLVDHVKDEEASNNMIIQTAIKGHHSFRKGVEQKLTKALFDSAKWKTKLKADEVKELELMNQQTRFRESFTWLYPVMLGTYTYKGETLTILVDDLAEKLAVQKPKELRKAIFIKRLVMTSAVIMLVALVGYIFWVMKSDPGF